MVSSAVNDLARKITPEPGEDQPAFAIRFHSTAKRLMPETAVRQAAMMQAWSNAGDPLAEQAAIDFPADKYERRDGVCEFKEHVAHNADGSQSHYSRDELAAMTRNMNARVAETGNYGSLIEGHTSDDPNAPQPDVLGHRGPYYLGQIGKDNPRWAIFSVEHHKRDMIPRLATRPTRSAEVWRSPRIEDRILDPVAALGAETPRLDLGMVRYQRTGTVEVNGQQVETERYAAACMPGAASVAVPTDKYADDEGDASMGLSTEDVNAIASQCAAMVMDTDEWQFIQSQMQNGTGEADATAEEVADESPADESGDELESVSEAPEPAPEATPEPASETPAPVPEPVAAATPELAPETAPAASPEPEPEGDQVEDRVAQLEAKIADLEAKLSGSQAEKYRRESLTSLRDKGYQIDVDDQLEIVADMTGEGFERYAKSLETTATRIPLADSPDVHETPEGTVKRDTPLGIEPEMERYSKAATQHALRNRMSFAEALELAKAGKIT